MNLRTAASPLFSRPAWLRSITPRSVILTLALATIGAAALNPIFVTSFGSLLARTVSIALMLLLAFSIAGQWEQKLLPRWVSQLMAVALTAPLATAAVYIAFTGGNVFEFIGDPWRLAGFMWIAGTAAGVGIVLALVALYRERDAQARAQELQFALEKATLERQALDAKLRALHAQIEPHFLFNTLANVQALVESGSPRAAPVLQSLIGYLRSALPQLSDSATTLGAEAELVRAYLELMQLRMPDRLQYSVHVDPVLAALRFAPMVLLTLVENAVRHGIDPSEEGGRIDVGASRDASNGRLRLWVSDSGIGMRETARPGTGLTNLRARLDVFFAGRAQLELSENEPRGVRAQIVIDESSM